MDGMLETRKIGQRIRELRTKRNITLRTLSTRTGLTSSLLSLVERNLANPSVSSLHKIAVALDVSIGSFFDTEDGQSAPEAKREEPKAKPEFTIVHQQNRKVLSPCPGITYYLLTKDLRGKIEFIFTVFEVGADTGEDLFVHEGEECCLVQEGQVEIQIGDESYVLEEGDSLRFDCSVPHRVRNIGQQIFKGIWVITPPSF